MNGESGANLSSSQRALLAVKKMRSKLDALERARKEPLAIIGVGCRFPKAPNPEAFWRLLHDGVDAVTEVPASRWDIDKYYDADPEAPGKMYTRYGTFLDGIEEFDSQFFGISPREAASMDPQQRLLLEVSWEALEDAGQITDSLRGSATGVFVGICSNEYLQRCISSDKEAVNIDAYLGIGNANSAAAGRISYTLGLQGPSMAVDTACSASLLAVHLACQSLRQKECNMALACGVNLLLSPFSTINFCKARMLATDGRCKTFDASADGYVRGEGCGAIVLKRLSDAIADRDNILAVVRGSAVNQDGRSGGITAPNGPSQEAVIRKALDNAGLTPLDVSYIEAHGTGTSLGDPIEVKALANVMSKGRSVDWPLILGSVKTNLGHLEGAAGIVGLIKVLLALHHKTIPPHLHFTTPSPYIPWEGNSFLIPQKSLAWDVGDKKRIAGISAFGFIGTNVHIVLEEAPPVSVSESKIERSTHLLTLTAKNEKALQELAAEYAHHLEQTDATLADICFTANCGRMHLPHRLLVVSNSLDHVTAKLQDFASGYRPAHMLSSITDNKKNKLAFIFAGRGAQYSGMGQELYQTSPIFRQAFDQGEQAFAPYRNSSDDSSLDIDASIFALEYALAKLWLSWGIKPSVVMGGGIGFYVAACIAEIVSLEDAGKLIAGCVELPENDSKTAAIWQQVAYRVPKIKFIVNSGDIANAEVGDAHYWRTHAQQALQFHKAIDTARKQGCTIFMEIGPQALVTKMGRRLINSDSLWLPSLQSDKRDWLQMFATLGELYIRGVKVDWCAFDRDYSRHKVALPTYRFQRKRCWLERDDRLPATVWGEIIHPLLGQQLSSPVVKERLFQNQIKVDVPAFLQDHLIGDMFVYPATAYLEAALAAAKQVVADDARIQEVMIHEPLILQKNEIYNVQLVLSEQEQEQFSFRIFSTVCNPQDEENGWKLHAAGKIVGGEENPSAIAIDKLRQNCSQEIAADLCYRQLRENGLQYQGSFRGLSELWQGQNEALGRIKLPPQAGDYQLHPALLDACLQLLAVAATSKQDSFDAIYLPVSVENLQTYAAIPNVSHIWGHVRLHSSDHSNSEMLFADATLINDNGVVVAQARRIGFKRAGRETLLRLKQKPTHEWLYQLQWQQQSLDEVEISEGRWLIFADQQGITAELLRLLERQATCVVVTQGEAFQLDARGNFEVNPLQREDFQNLFAELAHREEKYRGVLYLWSLDENFSKDAEPRDLLNIQQKICGGLVYLVQTMISCGWKSLPQLWLVTQEAQPVHQEVDIRIAQSTLWGLGRVISMEHPELKCVRIDIDADNAAQLLCREIHTQGEDQIAFRNQQRFVARLVRGAFADTQDLKLPQDRPFQMEISQRGVLDNLVLREAAAEAPQADDVVVRVHSIGLNFRDVLNALGLYPGDPGPFGCEGTGEIVAVGNQVTEFKPGDQVVTAFAYTGTFRTFACVNKHFVVLKPENISFEEAATIPITFLTAHYGLCHLAKIGTGDRVLIHAAAGGVGMAAVQIARQAGAEIFGTAGNPQKRALLKSMGVHHVMDSRSLAFAEQIMQITNGEGIDIVLNSLAGDFIGKSLELLRQGGRFIEIGKIELWTPEQVAAVNDKASYTAFDLGELCRDQPQLIHKLLQQLMQEFASARFKPLPQKIFPIHKTKTAFRYMAQAKHVGKIVICQHRTTDSQVVRAEASYLLTGGLGSLGLQVARWLVASGARHLVLSGRRPPSAAAEEVLQQLRDQGANIVVAQADVTSEQQLAALIAAIDASKPLRGIIHAAGVLDDGVIIQQNWQRFAKVMAPKIQGAWNLHRLTQDMQLDFLVLFSSVASVLGSPGQANYAAANAFLDALAHQRHLQGLSTLTINWGPWAQVGMAADLGKRGAARWTMQGIEAIGVEDGLSTMEKLLAGNSVQTTVLPIKWKSFLGQFVGKIPPLLQDMVTAVEQRLGKKLTALTESKLAKQLAKLPAGNRQDFLIAHIQEQVASVLGVDSPQSIDPNQGFFDMGMDSLTAIELKNSLENTVGQAVPATLIFDYPNIHALTDYILQELMVAEVKTDKPAPQKAAVKLDEPIAVIGMACRFPGKVDSPDSYWQLLHDGIDAISEIPGDRWNADDYYDPDPQAPGKTYTRWGGFLQDIDKFDARFFGISPREAADIDPQQRLLVEVAWEALENAGQVATELAGSQTGVFIGISTNDYSQLGVQYRHLSSVGPYAGTGNTASVASGRLSYLLGLQGPNFALDTACSSSLVTVHLACQSLQRGECSMALAGGVNVLLSPLGYIYFSKLQAMSADGRCKTFDADADGYVRGEGCGIVVLKRLSEAIATGDNVLGVIRGTAINHDGSSSGLTVPNGPSQQAVIKQALLNASVEPLQIGYVETHGTGTALGDPIEVTALGEALCRNRPREKPLLIGSVKTNIGHLEASAGVASLIKVILALQKQAIPAHLHFQNPSPHIPWEDYAIKVVDKLLPWQSGDKRIAGVSSFGFSGTNAHIVVEEAPPTEIAAATAKRPWHLLTLSTKDANDLPALADKFASLLDKQFDISVANICFTANTTRNRFNYRLAVLSNNSISRLREKLQAVADEIITPNLFTAQVESASKLAWVFAGNGRIMAKQLYRDNAVFGAAIDECAHHLQGILTQPLPDLLPGDDASPAASSCALPVNFAVEYAMAKLWQSWGLMPDVVCGYDAGEYVAACIAGVLSLENACRLIGARWRLLQSLEQQAAVAVLADQDRVASVITGHEVKIVAINADDLLIIAGHEAPLRQFVAKLHAQQIATQILSPMSAAHTPLVATKVAEFGEFVETVDCEPAQIPIVSSLTGTKPQSWNAQYWCRQLCEPVQFATAMQTLHQDGVLFMEIGSLHAMGKRCLPDSSWVTAKNSHADHWLYLLSSLAQLYLHGKKIDWQAVDGDYAEQRVTIPTYPFQRQRYWLEIEETSSKIGTQVATTPTVHPLLGERVASPAVQGTLFRNRLQATAPSYLGDHVVHGMVIFPATGYLEMGLAAAAFIGSGQLVDVGIYEPLLLQKDQIYDVQLILEENNAQPASFQVVSEIIDPEDLHQEASWRVHAGGKIVETDAIEESLVNVNVLRENFATQVPVDAYYRKLQANGLEYGTCFRGIEQLWHREGEALGLLQLASTLHGDNDIYLLHPALMDACLQLLGIAAAGTQDSSDVYLPLSVESIAVYGHSPTRVWGHATLQKTQSNQEMLMGDARLFDDDGSIVAIIKGIGLKRARREVLMQITRKQTQDWLYEIAWRSHSPAKASEAIPAGDWLIFADSQVGSNLAQLLKQQGRRCIVVRYGEHYAQEDDSFTINPEQRSHVRQMLEKLATLQVSCYAILHLWSLEIEPASQAEVGLLATQMITCGSVLHLTQELATADWQKTPRLCLVTRGAQALDNSEITIPFQAPLWGVGRVIALEHPELKCLRIDLDPQVNDDLKSAKLLLQQVATNDGEDQVIFRNDKSYVPRLVRSSPTSFGSKLALPGEQPYQLQISERGVLDNLTLQATTREQPGTDEVIIAVRAVGLNFRDVLSALDLYPGDPGPFGCECSGTIAEVGDNVREFKPGDAVIAAFAFTGTFRSFARVSKYFVVPKPDNISFAEAATIPITFLTAYYGLYNLAKISAGERVLIHAAAGGVGMAAVQIAKQVGAEIFGTAGNPQKRALVKSLGVHHVMDSRSLDFSDEIMRITNGEGVDIVLNSLAGDFIAHSLKLLRENGRFIEIGKIELWDDDKVKQVNNKASYQAFDLGELCQNEPQLTHSLFQQLMQEFTAGKLQPLPQKIFPIREVVNAFRYMAQAKHVGKIVIDQQLPAATSEIIRAQATYLISGGLGSLGLQVSRWLVDRGARHLVLLGRKAPSPEAEQVIAQLKAQQAQVTIAQTDITERQQLVALLENVEQAMPPLRGVIHAAGVLDDGMLIQQNWQRFTKVLAPKLVGAWNLHCLTMDSDLDFFILFSSMASVFGSPGQVNYTAANAFLDSLAQYRRPQGLNALSVNWGPWAGVGMAAELGHREAKRWESRGIGMIDVGDGLQVLTKAMDYKHAQLTVVPIKWSKFLGQFLAGEIPPLFADMLAKAQQHQKGKALEPSTLVKQLEKIAANKRLEVLITHMQKQIAAILGIPAHTVDPQQGFFDMGMDSLTAIEMKNSLQNAIGHTVTPTSVFKYPNIHDLAEYVLNEVLALQPQQESAPDPQSQPQPQSQTEAAPQPVANNLEQLSQDELAGLLAKKLQDLKTRRGQ